MKTALVLVGVSLIAIVGLYVWFSAPDKDRDRVGTTEGIIVVDSPAVFSRERLVNDRFKQAAWLQWRLDNKEGLEWGIQGEVRKQRTTQQQAELAAGGSPASGAASAAQEPPGSAGKAMVETKSTGQVPAREQGKDGVVVSPIDQFRDELAYREEIRTAAMETLLDDRHDIAGNTLYRTKFSVTVFPEHDTSAWAVVVVQIVKDKDASRRPNSEDIYNDWLNYYQEQLNSALDRMIKNAQSSDAREFREFDLPAFAVFIEGKISSQAGTRERMVALVAEAQARREQDARKPFIAEAKQTFETCKADQNKDPNSGLTCNPPEEAERKCDAGEVSEELCPWLKPMGRLQTLLEAYRNTVSESERTSYRTSVSILRKLAAEYVVDGLKKRVSKQSGDSIWNISILGCESGLCRIVLESAPNGAERLAEKLDVGHQVFSYTVSPKEAIQRISNLMAARRELQVALQGGVSTLPESLRTQVVGRKADDALMTSILRKPLIVGFSGVGGLGNEDDVEKSATFGWIIGPKFALDDSTHVTFRHTPIQNDVSAIISVPSWWRWANAKVTVCWIDERQVSRIAHLREGFVTFNGCKDRVKVARDYPIQLPGGVTEIARKVGLDVVRHPSVTAFINNQTVQAGLSADFLIIGNHLWRSTVVVLGGQTADEIIVLPDMKGIVARFKEIKQVVKTPNLQGTAERLWVWTSEGSVWAGNVTILPAPQSAQKGGIPGSTPQVGATVPGG